MNLKNLKLHKPLIDVPKASILEASVFELSYIGDVYFELWVRTQVVLQPITKKEAQNKVVSLVRCQSQAEIVLLLKGHLTPSELAVFSRGKNAQQSGVPKHATKKIYRLATAFECLIGYWYLKDDLNRFISLMQLKEVDLMVASKLDK